MAYALKRAKAFIQTKTSPKLTPVELVELLLRYTTWADEDLITAVAICGAESGFRTRAINIAKNGTEDYGLFQVNSIHKPDMEKVYDPEYNVREAFLIWYDREKRKGPGTGFSAWVAYKRNKHLAFMPMAREAYEKVTGYQGEVDADV